MVAYFLGCNDWVIPSVTITSGKKCLPLSPSRQHQHIVVIRAYTVPTLLSRRGAYLAICILHIRDSHSPLDFHRIVFTHDFALFAAQGDT